MLSFLPLLAVFQVTFFSINNSIATEGEAIVAFFKLLFVVFAFLYVLFAIVVTRQIKIMRTTLITSFSPMVRLIGYVHLVAAVLVFLLLLFLL